MRYQQHPSRMRPLFLRVIRRVTAFFSTSQSKEVVLFKIAVIVSLYLSALALGRALVGSSPGSVNTGGTSRCLHCRAHSVDFIVMQVWAVCVCVQRPELLIVNLHLSKQADRRDARHCAGEKLTIVINTFKRLDLLKNSVQHYSTCPFVSRIHVNWAESTTPPDVEKCQCCQTEVTFALPLLTHNDSSLNTRFHPIPGVLHRLVRATGWQPFVCWPSALVYLEIQAQVQHSVWRCIEAAPHVM